MILTDAIRAAFRPALEQLSPNPEKVADFLGMVKPAANAEHGDYQANFAMPLGKLVGKKPPEVAKELIAKVSANDMFDPPTSAGPGFINVRLKSEWIAQQVQTMAGDERLGIAVPTSPKRVVIDYSSPNVAKPLHVGHLRSTIIGDALTRLLRYLGHTVITDNHLGDWGTQFGMLIFGYRNFLDRAAYESDPVRELARIYVYVRGQFRADDEDPGDGPTDDPVKLACQQETAKLHAGDPANVALWNEFMPHCREAIHRVYRRLGILTFDHEHGESFYNPMLANVVEDLLAKGIAFESKGAIVIPNAAGNIPQTEAEQRKQDPPALIRKRDGAFTYATSDLATVKYRIDSFQPNAMLYVVDFRQALHFKTFFAQARRWGFAGVELTHVSFGSVLGPDRKPFSTRAGGAAELETLIDEAVTRGLAKYEESYADRKSLGHDVPEFTDATKQDIAEAIGVGAMKYADLSGNRTSDYIFSYDKMLATDGNTATYMQYAYARCRAIFRKGQVDDARFRTNPPPVFVTQPAERALGLQLLRFEEALQAAATEYTPHDITAYMWDLARAFSGFFEYCPVLTADSPELRDSRLVLVDLTGRVIRQGLELLGIRVVERM